VCRVLVHELRVPSAADKALSSLHTGRSLPWCSQQPVSRCLCACAWAAAVLQPNAPRCCGRATHCEAGPCRYELQWSVLARHQHAWRRRQAAGYHSCWTAAQVLARVCSCLTFNIRTKQHCLDACQLRPSLDRCRALPEPNSCIIASAMGCAELASIRSLYLAPARERRHADGEGLTVLKAIGSSCCHLAVSGVQVGKGRVSYWDAVGLLHGLRSRIDRALQVPRLML